MRSLGLDVGDKRTGVAISDPQGILATPLTVLASEDKDALINEIIKLAEQYEVERIVVGLPYSLNGDLGRQAEKAISFSEKLSHYGLNIQLWDERLSTKGAERLMIEAGTKRNKLHSRAKGGAKNSYSSAKVSIDAMAAAFILQGFLDSHHPEQ